MFVGNYLAIGETDIDAVLQKKVFILKSRSTICLSVNITKQICPLNNSQADGLPQTYLSHP